MALCDRLEASLITVDATLPPPARLPPRRGPDARRGVRLVARGAAEFLPEGLPDDPPLHPDAALASS